MNAPHRLTMTGEEYLAWEARQERKHELVNGVVRLMAGGTVAHNTIALNCAVALRIGLKGGPCNVFVSDLKVRTRDHGYRYPDVTVDCGAPNSKDLFADKPTVIVEVLSPSTEWFDETDKLDEYRSIASVNHVVLLSQQRPFARVWTRDGELWRTQDADGMDAEIALSTLGLRLAMNDVYEGVEFADNGLDE
jgi:Uma2 family endonuclease